MNFEQPSSIGPSLMTLCNHLSNLRLLLIGQFRSPAADASFPATEGLPYPTCMEQRRRTPSRIRCPRGSDPRVFTAEAHRSAYLMAYAEPAYPDEAKAQGIEGKVVLDALIDSNGVIQTLSVRTGHPLLAESALQTVRTWRYRPTKLNGVPVEVNTDIEVTFTLPNIVASS